LLEEIACGGMGVVYRARQRSLNRVVALKLLLFGTHATPEAIKRFRAEAVAAAALQHPNIVAIHEVGVHEGQHFIVMDYVEGQCLSARIHGQPLPARVAARYVRLVAEAIQFAHERGILHRDLKPSNVLIDANDQPRVTDFGLAKRLDDSQLSTLNPQLTLTGQVLGSPSYIPPEQASGKRGALSRRTDVYALGAILYHALTGRPPFVAESMADTLQQVLHADPVSPRALNASVPADLETVCLKCLEKEPAKRYATAELLAQELARFLEGKPVLARPVSRLAKTRRWCRRKPQVAGLAAVAILSFLLGFTGVIWQWRQSERHRQRAAAGELSARQNAYVLAMNAAQQALKENNPGRALELLNRQRPTGKSDIRNPKSEIDLRGFEWRYLWQQCQTEAEAVMGTINGGVRSLQLSPDGRWLVAGSESGAASLWDLSTGEQIPLIAGQGVRTFAAFSPDSRRLLFTDQSQESVGTIAVWDLHTRKRLAPIKDPNPIGPIAFSADGKWLGVGVNLPTNARGLLVLDAETCRKVREQRSTTGMMGDTFHGFDWAFVPHRDSVIFSENEPDLRLGFWDFSADPAPEYFAAHREAITTMAIRPDGRMLATGAGWTETNIKLWEIPTFRPVGELSGHAGWIMALRFSPDGQTLASASADQTMRLWHVPTQKEIRVFSRLRAPVWRVCFTLDGRKLLSGDAEGAIQRWPVETRPSVSEPGFRRLRTGLKSQMVAPDGRQFAGMHEGRVYLGEVQGAAAAAPLADLGTNNTCLLFSADGQALFVGTETGEIQVWSLVRQAVERRLRGLAEPVRELRQDQAGQRLIVLQAKRPFIWPPYQLSVWSTRDWQRQTAFEFSAIEAARSVSPDGHWLATARNGGPVRLWSLSGLPRTNAMAFSGSIQGTAFSPDGRLLAAVTQEGVVKAWELPSCHEVKKFRARSQDMFALAFSPDSRRLATAGEGDEAIKLWDVATWQELITLQRPGESLRQLAFSADGHQLTALNSQGDVLVWRVPFFAEIEANERKERSQ